VIRFASVTIAAREDCLDLDSTHQFVATVQGLTNQALEWDASVGDIDDDGFYRAPSARPEDGMAIIVARSIAYPEVADSTVVSLGCSCTFSISVGGAAATDTPGYRLLFSSLTNGVPPQDDIILLIQLQDGETDDYGITMGISPDQLAKSAGTYALEVGGTFPLVPPDFAYGNTQDAIVSLDILAYVPETLLVGRAYGSVEVTTAVGGGEFEERIEPFVMSFEIRVPEDWDPPHTAAGSQYVCEIGGGGGS
jgi:hypothetical protein